MATAAFLFFQSHFQRRQRRNLHRRFRRKLRHLGRGAGFIFSGFIYLTMQRRHLRHRHELLVVSGRFRWNSFTIGIFVVDKNHLDWQIRESKWS